MSDIFISYAREDVAAAQEIAERARRRGYRVWWDRSLIAGTDFSVEIERQINQAHRVVVIWSRHSVLSNWVRDEASLAARQSKLLPICIDGSEPPMGFRSYHVQRINSWDDDFKRILDALPAKAQFHTAIYVAREVPSDKSQLDSLLRGLDKSALKASVNYLKKHGYSGLEAYGRNSGRILGNLRRAFGALFSSGENDSARPVQQVRGAAASPRSNYAPMATPHAAAGAASGAGTARDLGDARHRMPGSLIERFLAFCVDLVAGSLIGAMFAAMAGGQNFLDLVLFVLGWIAYHWLTMTLFMRGQTLGYALTRLDVLSRTSGRPPGVSAVVLFAMVRLLLSPIGWLWYFKDRRRRMLHDLMTGTVVLMRR